MIKTRKNNNKWEKKLAGNKWRESKTTTEKEFSRAERRKADNEKILRRKETKKR